MATHPHPDIFAFEQLTLAYCDQGLTRSQAVSQVARRHPEAHARYLVATNKAAGRNVVARELADRSKLSAK